MNEIEVAFLRVLSAGGSSVAFSTWKMGKITRSIWKWKVSRLVGRMWGTIGPCEDDGKGLENSALHCTGKQSGDWREEGMKTRGVSWGWEQEEEEEEGAQKKGNIVVVLARSRMSSTFRVLLLLLLLMTVDNECAINVSWPKDDDTAPSYLSWR